MRTKPARAGLSLAVEVAEDYEAMSRRAEQLIVTNLRRRPRLLLCASAGGTPTRLYQLLAARRQDEPRLFDRLRVLQIDEWGGLPPAHPATCDEDLRVKLVAPLRLSHDRYVSFRTDASDPEAECQRVAEWLAQNGPIDLCILGLGLNGHVAMNEPAAAITPEIHVAKLARGSLNHAMLQNLERKPTYGLTLGLRDILSSRQILLLVNGQKKQKALGRLLRPQVTTRFPASFLWLHSDATVLCDRASMPEFSPISPASGSSPRTPNGIISPVKRRRAQRSSSPNQNATLLAYEK